MLLLSLCCHHEELDISARLCMSPCSSDYIISNRSDLILACSL